MSEIDTAFVAIQFWCDDPDGTDEDLRAIIASAIREAEASARNEALEEAAVILENGVADVRRFHGRAGSTSSPWAASVVRNLKTKD